MSDSSVNPDRFSPAAEASAIPPAAKAVPATGEKLRGADKVARIPIKVAPTAPEQRLRKPAWIRARFPGTPEVVRLKQILRDNRLHLSLIHI